MTSIVTNVAAMSALQTLRSLDSTLADMQAQVSSGLRIETAADNAAYWSISTTMRSDNKAIAAVADAIGLGQAKIDVAYAGIDAVTDVLSEFKARLVAAKEPGVDTAKIQKELEQLKQQVVSVAQSSSFSGENWLNTDVEDINDSDLNRVSLVSSFNRSGSGVSIGTTDFHLSEMSLFNESGGGILQSDTRKLKTLGGIRIRDTYMDEQGIVHMEPTNDRDAAQARFEFDFTGPIEFDATSSISFDVTVDADDPSILDGPYNPGKTTHVVVNRALVDTWLPGQNGIISNYRQMASVLYRALTAANSGASASNVSDGSGGTVPPIVSVSTRENSGLDGSAIQITNFAETLVGGASSGMSNTVMTHGGRGSSILLRFDPFEVYNDGDNKDGVRIDFDFGVNGSPRTHHSFDRTYVNDLLGKDTGKIETADEMVTLLTSLISPDWPDVLIDIDASGRISMRSDKDVDRLQGARTYIGFTNIAVSIEPIAEQNFLDIDIVENADWLDRYIGYIEVVSADVIDAGATLGALKSRLDMQQAFTQTLMDTIDTGIGGLIDADMDEASTRLKALQTQQQLAIQSLQIANTDAQNIMQLFQ